MKTTTGAVVFFMLLCSACGDDAAGGIDGSIVDASLTDAGYDATTGDGSVDAALVTCDQAPFGEVNGSVLGHEVGPVENVFYDRMLDIDLIRIDERQVSCGDSPDSGQYLSFYFECGGLAIKTYTVIASADCPTGSEAYVELGENFSDPIDSASAGTVTITQVQPCVAGYFDLRFVTGGTMSGTFAATRCGGL